MLITNKEVEIQQWPRTDIVISNKKYKIVNTETGSKVLIETTLLLPKDEKLVLTGPKGKEYDDQYERFVNTLEL